MPRYKQLALISKKSLIMVGVCKVSKIQAFRGGGGRCVKNK